MSLPISDLPQAILPATGGFFKYLEYLSLRLIALLVNLLPYAASTWLARRVGDLLYDVLLRKRRKTALENIQRVFGDTLSATEKNRIARASLRNLVTSLMELFRMPKLVRDGRERFEIEGDENTDRVFREGRGVILVISHIGSWESLALLPHLKGYHCSVVVRESRNAYLDHWINNLRASSGLFPVNRKASMKYMLKELKAHHLTAILIDQWAGPDGEWIDFFGQPTSTTSIPARLAQHTGAALVPACCLRSATGHYKIRIFPEVPVVSAAENPVLETTRALNRELEKLILQYPEQWTWTHRRWKPVTRYQKSA